MRGRQLAVVAALFAACARTDPDTLVEGLPAADHAWSTAELRAADDVLHQHLEHLPRFHGEASGAAFDRLVAPTVELAGSVIDRFEAHVTRIRALGSILRMYEPRSNESRETAEILVVMLRESVAVYELLDAVVAAVRADPSHAVDVPDVVQAHAGWATAFAFAFTYAADEHVPQADRRVVVDACVQYLPYMFPSFVAADQLKIWNQLGVAIDVARDGALHDELAALATALHYDAAGPHERVFDPQYPR